MSLEALAAAASVAKNTINQVENAEGNPTIGTLTLIATALDVVLEISIQSKADSKTLSAIPPEVWAGWRKVNAEGKALCLYILTENPLFFDFLPEQTQAKLLAILRTLRLNLPERS